MSFRKISLANKQMEGLFPPLAFLKASSFHIGGLSVNLTNPGNASTATPQAVIALSKWTNLRANATGTFHRADSDLSLASLLSDCSTLTTGYDLRTVHAKSLQSCLTVCDPMDCSSSGSSVHEILQARMLEWVPMPSSRGSSQSRDRTCIS